MIILSATFEASVMVNIIAGNLQRLTEYAGYTISVDRNVVAETSEAD